MIGMPKNPPKRGHVCVAAIPVDGAVYGGPRKRAIAVSSDEYNLDPTWPHLRVIPRTTCGHRISYRARIVLGAIESPASDMLGSYDPQPGIIDCLQLLPFSKEAVTDVLPTLLPNKRLKAVSCSIKTYLSSQSDVGLVHRFGRSIFKWVSGRAEYGPGALYELHHHGKRSLFVVVSNSTINRARVHPKYAKEPLLTVVRVADWDRPDEPRTHILLDPTRDQVDRRLLVIHQTVRTIDLAAYATAPYLVSGRPARLDSTRMRVLHKLIFRFLGIE